MSAPIIPGGPEAYAHAIDILRRGGLVALPTETVYGLAGDACNDTAVERIYAAKGRPAFNPLIVHVMAPHHYERYGEASSLSLSLAGRFWPAPLTLVMPQNKNIPISKRATAGLDTIALRCPDAAWTHGFRTLGFSGPLVMPSANPSGRISPTTAAHVAEDLGDKVDLIIDGGPCPSGVESTVIRIHNNTGTLLRPGAISIDTLMGFDARVTTDVAGPDVLAPGMLKSHYAPKAKVRLNAKSSKPGEHHLGFGGAFSAPGLNLSPSGDVIEAAQNLFAYMRQLDKQCDIIAVAPIPMDGIGAAINDRLKRAAAT